jgi:hypothetical protein
MKKTKWIWITLAAVLVSLFALGFTALAAETEEAGDMNGDGILNSADATVSPSEYQSVMTYATNGNFLDSPAKMTDVSGKPCRYLYVEFGTMKDVFVPKADEAKAINVFLPRYREP